MTAQDLYEAAIKTKHFAPAKMIRIEDHSVFLSDKREHHLNKIRFTALLDGYIPETKVFSNFKEGIEHFAKMPQINE